MRFQKFVSRTTKGLFLFLVLLMAVSLVLSGTLGGPTDRDRDADAGIIFENVHVSLREWELHLRKAMPAYYWENWLKDLADPAASFRRRTRPKPPPPKEEQLASLAWENIILLEDARRKGIVATPREVDLRLRDIFLACGRGQPQTDENFQQVAGLFNTSLPVLEAWVADRVVLDKLLNLVEEGAFADFNRVYEEVSRGNRMARIWVAGIDPNEFLRDLKPVRSEEVARHYEANKERYKVGEKVQISYLMAEYEEFGKKVPEPSEEEIRAYYEGHRDEFRKPPEEHAHAPGQEPKAHEPPAVRGLEEVRPEIRDRLRREKARVEARKVMERIDTQIGASFKDGKYPEDLFDRIRDEAKREGIVLVHDVTGAFGIRDVDEIEKILGENGDLRTWAFDAERKAGDISRRNDTTKGSLFYRIQKKTPSYDPGLTEPVRKAIERDLTRQQLQKRASAFARNLVQEIEKNGFAAARRKHLLDWRPSRYFGLQKPHESGLEEPRLALLAARQVAEGQLNLQKRAATFPGFMVSRNPEKREWTFVVCLEDVLERPPEDPASEFRAARERIEREVRQSRRREYVTQTVALANRKDLRPKKGEPPGPEPRS